MTMYESVIEEMLAAALDARQSFDANRYDYKQHKDYKPDVVESMLAAARAVAEKRINEISEQWKGCAESLAMFLAPYPRNRVRKGLTWAQAWPTLRSGEYTFWRFAAMPEVYRFDADHRISLFNAMMSAVDISTSADFSGEVQP